MTPNIAIAVNAVLATGILTALALVVRLALRLPQRAGFETIHPSQPVELAVYRESELRRAA